MFEILTYPNPALQMKAEAVRRFDGELVRLVDGMFAVMRRAGGCGLAAVQVGFPLRVLIAVDLPGRELSSLNPQITDRQGWAEAEENCLSVPCVSGRVWRATRVSVEGCDVLGRLVQAVDLSGLMACIVQHEIDHLDGVLFIDRIVNPGVGQLLGSRGCVIVNANICER